MDGIGHVKVKKTRIRFFLNENLRFLEDECKILRACNCSLQNLKRCGLETHSKIIANIQKQVVKKHCV